MSNELDKSTTREKILDAALDVFSIKGYHDTRLDEIVVESGTSKGSIYFHFPNKEKLFIALVDKFADLLEKRVSDAVHDDAPGIQRVRAALEAVLNTFSKYRRPAKILLVQATGLGRIFDEKRMDVHNRFAGLIKTYLDEAVALGDLAPMDTEIVSRAWMGAINELVIRWVYTGDPEPPRILETLVPLLLRSVGYEQPEGAA
ncbi:MAG: TetR/AcrR family transcriptional regulator [Phototrophicaceae bacterium]|jgi:AcrR family transcriptional regulator